MATATERAADYHQDNGDVPTLSSTIARLLIQKTPAHAKAAHPRLTEQPVRKDSAAMDMGTAVHQLLLRDDRVDILKYDSYRTKDAQTARDESRAAGRVPMLEHAWYEAREIAEHVNGRILQLSDKPTPFTKGTAEHVMRWTDYHGVECRAMLDWLRDDHQTIDDLKTTGLTAHPQTWARKLFNMGYDIQAAFYTRGVMSTYAAAEPRFRWIVVETKPPYPVSLITLSDRAMASAQVKVDTAIQVWGECLASGEWPAYSLDPFEADLPAWMDNASDRWADVDLETVPF